MTDEHARFSPSAAERIINCPPSLLAGEGMVDEASIYAMEGSEAHELAEFKVRTALKMNASDPRNHMKYLGYEMEEATDVYKDHVLETYAAVRTLFNQNPEVFTEQKVDFSRFVDGGFGTSDTVIIGDGELHIIDFKYGKGVEVAADNNAQLKCYALGALEDFGYLYDIGTVVLHIVQPRMSNISEFTISVDELYRWAEEDLKPAAEKALAGLGEFNSGSWCRFCKCKAICRKANEKKLELAKRDFSSSAMLSDNEIGELLPILDDLKSWADELKDYATRLAVAGRKWAGWKIVAGRSTRKYRDEAKVAEKVEAAGFDPWERRILGITDMAKMLGTRFNEILGDLVYKPEGKPTLVPDSDRRSEMNDPKKDFG